jgi:hypothetical protein
MTKSMGNLIILSLAPGEDNRKTWGSGQTPFVGLLDVRAPDPRGVLALFSSPAATLGAPPKAVVYPGGMETSFS